MQAARLCTGDHPGCDGSAAGLADARTPGTLHLADCAGPAGLSLWRIASNPGLPAPVALDVCSHRFHPVLPGVSPGDWRHAHFLRDGSQPVQSGWALLSIITSSAVLYLVLRIPGMLRIWALRPIAEAGPAAVRAAQGTVESAVGTGLRLMALL